MSSESADELIAAVGRQTRALQEAVDAFDEAVAARLGINRTDLRCLDVLLQEGPVSPGRLAVRLGLTTGSVTVMLDRLARLGYLVRSPDPADRRKVVVAATDDAMRHGGEIYGPLASEGTQLLQDFTAEQLQLVLDFLRLSRQLQERHLERVRGPA